MRVEKLVHQAIKGLKRDRLEIRPGLANVIKLMSRIAPDFIAHQLGKLVDPMLLEMEASAKGPV